MLTSILNGQASSIQLVSILFCSLAAIILGMMIALVHQYTSKSSKNYLITLCTLPLIVSAVILMVNGNLGTSIATLGVFGLIRFRSLPATSKEIVTVFFAMAVGLACGMGQLAFAFILTLVGCFSFYFFSQISLLNSNQKERTLKVILQEDDDLLLNLTNLLKENTKSYQLINMKTSNSNQYEMKYHIDLKKEISDKQLLDQMKQLLPSMKIQISIIQEESEF